MEEDDEEFDGQDELNEQLELSVSRFEEMIRKQDRYFFDVDALIRILDFYSERGEYSKALEVVRYSFSLHPNSVNLLMKQAHLFAITGQDQRALDTLDKIEKISPYDLELHIVRGNIFNTIGSFSAALECFKKALPMSEVKDELYFSMAITYQNMQNYPKAIDHFKMAIQCNSSYELAMEELTACLGITGKLPEGLVFFQSLIDKDPYSYAAWYNLGDIHCRMGQYEEALSAFDYCLLIRDDFAPAYLDQAHVLAMLGHFEDAIQKYKQTFEYFNPDGITYFNIAECYEKLERMDEARTYYKKAVKLLPEMAQAWYGIALTLEFEERWYEAIHYIRKAIEKDPGNPEYILLLGDCEFNLNNLTEAWECYCRVTEEEPSYIDGWLSLAHFLTETGNPQEAVNVTDKALTLMPECAELIYRQVVNLYCAGYLNEAYEYMETAMDKDFSHLGMVFELLPSLRNDQTMMNLVNNKRNNS
jgi:tetratricopeptide (TPR) repeat protein